MIAAGEPVPYGQSDIQSRGPRPWNAASSAEDPKTFTPSTGKIRRGIGPAARESGRKPRLHGYNVPPFTTP